MQKIAVIGAHGAGKSTLTYQLAAYYKSDGANVDIVQERIRFSPFPYNDKMTQETALWAFNAQMKRELESQKLGFDTIICDRTAYDCFIYAEHFHLDSPIINISKQVAYEWLKTYNHIYFVIPDMPIKDDGMRSSAHDFQQDIHVAFMGFVSDILKARKLPLTIVKSSCIFDNKINFKSVVNCE